MIQTVTKGGEAVLDAYPSIIYSPVNTMDLAGTTVSAFVTTVYSNSLANGPHHLPGHLYFWLSL
jgi:hypothetical protein